MCGRYVLYSDSEYDELRSIVAETENSLNFKPGEIFPTDTAPAVVGNKLKFFRWGFYTYDSKLIVNARGETVDSKPSFKKSFLGKRCLIPANAYLEWKKESSGKVKYEIGLIERKLFFMAGLYNTFIDKHSNTFTGFVIITTTANEKASQIHDRMPVILEPGQEKFWIDEKVNDINLLKSIIKPYDSSKTVYKTAQ
ncbi:MAG: SOS response-associated peptidase [Bacillota bacterium]